MKVKLIKEYMKIPKGTVLQRVTTIGASYHGLWTSPEGSYYIYLPQVLCKIVT